MTFHRRFLSDLAGVTFILVLLPLLVMGAMTWLNTPQRARGSVLNQEDDGSSIFASWLQAQGFSVQMRQSADDRKLTNQDSVLFILAPRSNFSFSELYALDVWVRNGGTLIIGQENDRPRQLLRYYDMSLGRLWWPVARSSLVVPTFNWPTVGQATVNTNRYVKADCGQVAVHMGDCERPYLVAMGRGQGQVLVLSSVTPFTNEGLRLPGNAQLVENLTLATAVPGATILFDEAHRQLSFTWLFTTPTGWALWLSLLGVGLFIAWQSAGQPTQPRRARTSHGEKEMDTAVAINQLAAAERQFRRHDVIVNHYWQRLQRTLSRRHGVDPALPDAQFVEALKPHLGERELGTVIYLVSAKGRVDSLTEQELRQWVSVATDLSDRQPLTREIYEYQKTI